MSHRLKTYEEICKNITLNDQGVFYWKERIFENKNTAKGWNSRYAYLTVGSFVYGSVERAAFKFNKKQYSLVKLAWYYHYGYLPKKGQVKHIDGNCFNNSKKNLRLTE